MFISIRLPDGLVSGGIRKKKRYQTRRPKAIDEYRLEKRQKQIDHGHRTLGYIRYRLLVPLDQRKPDQPSAPRKTQRCSKRSWDGQMRKWRRELHSWDPPNPSAFETWLESQIKLIPESIDPEIQQLFFKMREIKREKAK